MEGAVRSGVRGASEVIRGCKRDGSLDLKV